MWKIKGKIEIVIEGKGKERWIERVLERYKNRENRDGRRG
jgi:hypothetical protein